MVSTSLLPLSWLFRLIALLRRIYLKHANKGQRLPVPVIVVGNITVGGTGKTPLVIWLATLLNRQGFKPGVVSRGYGGRSNHWPRRVEPDSDPTNVGDEPVLIASRTACPVIVGPNRLESARLLIDEFHCDVIISDDGLQHYRLPRDIEIAVIDGARRFGNGYCLPAGPLREPPQRLDSVDYVVASGAPNPGEYPMSLIGNEAVNLENPQCQKSLNSFQKSPVHAIAGIGNPNRFFTALRQQGITVIEHPFPDHHRFSVADLSFTNGDYPVMMTEKDAVKIRAYTKPGYWAVPVKAVMEERFSTNLLDDLRDLING